MKKYSILTLFFCLLVSMALFSPAQASPQVLLDDRVLSFDVQPVIENGRTLVPLRTIFEALGAEVQWEDAAQSVSAVKGNTAISLAIGGCAYKNGQEIPLDVPAKIVSSRTMVPLRFICESFGAMVNWNADTDTIYIASPGTPTFVHFIDVGQADAIYCQLPAHIDILIDAGNQADGSTVTSYLKNCGADNIELLIATHPHEDHIGGIPAVLGEFKVKQVIDSGKQNDTAAYRNYYKAVSAENASWSQGKGQTILFGNYAMQILTRADRSWNDLNDYSVVSRLDLGEIEFLFEGDAGVPVENILLGNIEADILKVGHHGSNSSSSTEFLNRIQPKIAVISVGEGNTYGHPTPKTISKLEAVGANILRTDLSGNIVIKTDGNTYSILSQYTGSTANNTQLPAVQPSVEQPSSEQSSESNTAGIYVGSIKSNKYHYPSCRYAKSILPKNLIWFGSAEEAKAAGYLPCGGCKP